MSSTEQLSREECDQLLRLARASIHEGLETGHPKPATLSAWPPSVQAEGASFVTLHRNGNLRGCIGALQARRPLVLDVAEHAYAAAFRDPRFPSLTLPELEEITIEIAVLTPAQSVSVATEAELLAELRPGRDGLILQDGPYRSTFLPSVWDSLGEPEQFVAALKHKAGLPSNHWSETLQFLRYETQSFSEQCH